MLVNSLVHEPYYTGDYVVRQGDPAHKLYFVYAGVLEVIPRVSLGPFMCCTCYRC